MLEDRRVVVTGGAGFIGSNLARSLCEENEVIVIDNLFTGRYENISDIADRIRFVRDDVNNLDMLMSEFQSADYVLHQAALPSVQRSVDDPVTTNKNNIDGMLNVLVAARDCGVKRVVFASSELRHQLSKGSYGNNNVVPKENNTSINKNASVFLGKVRAKAGLGVSNSESARTLGSLSKKMGVFDYAGASIGYVPIYSSIR